MLEIIVYLTSSLLKTFSSKGISRLYILLQSTGGLTVLNSSNFFHDLFVLKTFSIRKFFGNLSDRNKPVDKMRNAF